MQSSKQSPRSQWLVQRLPWSRGACVGRSQASDPPRTIDAGDTVQGGLAVIYARLATTEEIEALETTEVDPGATDGLW